MIVSFLFICCTVFSCSEWGLLSSCGMHTSHCSGFFCCRAWALEFSGFSSCSTWAQQLWLLGCRTQAQVVVVHGLSCPVARGIHLTQGSNPCLLHWQVDSLPLKPHPFFYSCTLALLFRSLSCRAPTTPIY